MPLTSPDKPYPIFISFNINDNNAFKEKKNIETWLETQLHHDTYTVVWQGFKDNDSIHLIKFRCESDLLMFKIKFGIHSCKL